MGKNPAQKSKEIEAKKKATGVVSAPKKAAKAKKKVSVASSEAKAAARSCKVRACKREYRAKGYCNSHYKMWRQGKYGIARYKTCKDNECRKPIGVNRHGYCETHFQNYYVKGIEVAKPVAPAAAPAAPKKEEKALAAG